MKIALLGVFAVACGSSKAPPSIVNHSSAPDLSTARKLERAPGTGRDYERAGKIYEQLCANGRGSLDACIAFVDAIFHGRGVTVDVGRIFELEKAMCTSHLDAVACLASKFSELLTKVSRPFEHDAPLDPSDQKDLEQRADRVKVACDHGDGRACEIAGNGGGDGSSAEHDRKRKFALACRSGRMDACGYVLIELEMCDEAPNIEDCEHGQLAAWRAHDYEHDIAEAAQTMIDSCSLGDATACEHIPSRRLPLRERCTAHDWSACAELGCVGDDTAKQSAVAHGVVEPNCGVANRKAAIDWRRTPGAHRPRFPPIVTDDQRPGGARPTQPWEAIRFQLHGGRDHHDWPRFDIYNMNDHAMTELAVCVYAYDGNQRQLARFTATPKLVLAPDALLALAIDDANAKPLPDGTTDVVIDYDHVRFEGDATATEDPARCDAQRPREQQGAYMHW